MSLYVVTATTDAVSRVSRTNALFLSATNASAPPPPSDTKATSATEVPFTREFAAFSDPTEPFDRPTRRDAPPTRSLLLLAPFPPLAFRSLRRRSHSASDRCAWYRARPPDECSADF